MSTLNKIAQSYGTDKSSDIHNYCVKYEKYLPFNRYDYLNILEIGILNGKSLKTWKEYYYRSNIVGIDINPDCKQYEEERISIEIVLTFIKFSSLIPANAWCSAPSISILRKSILSINPVSKR